MRRVVQTLVVMMVMLAVVGVVSADTRINPAANHIGGDTLFCGARGCELLNLHGVSLGLWPQADIDAAIAASDASGDNSQVAGEVQGTYGAVQLYVVFIGADTNEKQLCLYGHDEYNKENNFCFKRQASGDYNGVPSPSVANCTMWVAGVNVYVPDGASEVSSFGQYPSNFGVIVEVRPSSGTVIVELKKTGHLVEAGCDQIWGGVN